MRTALRGGVVNYLLKPFDQEALHNRLQQYASTHTSSTAAPTVGQTDRTGCWVGPAAGPLGDTPGAPG